MTSDFPKVVITGVGGCCASGAGEFLWEQLDRGVCAINDGTIDNVDGLPSLTTAPCKIPPLAPYLLDPKLAKFMSPSAAMAVVAAGETLKSAGLSPHTDPVEAMALYVSTSLAAFDFSTVLPAIEATVLPDRTLDMSRLGTDGFSRCHPLMPFKILANMPLGVVSIAFGIRGENFVLNPSDDQAFECLDAAIRGICAGRFHRALIGGTQQAVSLLPVATLARHGRIRLNLSQTPDTTVGENLAPADGACFLLLENADSAAERNAQILAQIDALESGHCVSLEQGVTWRAGIQAPLQSLTPQTGYLGSVATYLHLAQAARKLATGSFNDAIVTAGALNGRLGTATLSRHRSPG